MSRHQKQVNKGCTLTPTSCVWKRIFTRYGAADLTTASNTDFCPKCPQKNRSYSSPTTHPVIKPWHQTQSRHWYPGNDLILWSLDGAHGTEAWLEWQTNVGKRHLGAEDNMEGTLGWRRVLFSSSVAQAFKIKKGEFSCCIYHIQLGSLT